MANPRCCSSVGSDIFVDTIIPAGIIHRLYLGPIYKDNPVMSRIVATPIGVIDGIIKIPLFPVICLVNLISMPFVALYRTPPNHTDGGEWLKAWLFSFIGLAVSAAVVLVPVYYFNLLTIAGIYVSLFSFSIVIHVYKLVKEPPPQIPF